MKIIPPKPFTIEKGPRAILLLHGFAGNTNDVKRLGKYLSEHNYTVHTPLYTGHGSGPNSLIQSKPADWWQSTLNGYEELRNLGYKEIAVAGVSLGGIFALRLAIERHIKAIVPMSAPAIYKNTDGLQNRIIDYAINYKKLTGTYNEKHDSRSNIAKLVEMPELKNLQNLINDTSNKLNNINKPIHILRGFEDDKYYSDSADLIYNSVNSNIKSIKTFINSGHIMTLGKERDLIFKEIYHFFEGIQWNN